MKKKYTEEPAYVIIGKGMRVNAELISGKGIVRIEGEYFGDIETEGAFILEKSGQVCGNITVNSAYIAGSIAGNISCFDLLHIKTTGKVKGDIECDAILMDEGALFIGYSKMNERPPEADSLGIQDVIEDDI